MTSDEYDRLKNFENDMALSINIALKNWSYRSYKLKKRYFSHGDLVKMYGEEQIAKFENFLKIEEDGFSVDVCGVA